VSFVRAEQRSADEVQRLRAELRNLDAQLTARTQRGSNMLRAESADEALMAQELRTEIRAIRSEVADARSSEQLECMRAREAREHARQDARDELREANRKLVIAEDNALAQQERNRRIGADSEASQRDNDERVERLRNEARRLERELDEASARARIESRRHGEKLAEFEDELNVARRQLSARDAEISDLRKLADARSRQEEANTALKWREIVDREAAIEDRQRDLNEKWRLLRIAERNLQRRLAEIEDASNNLVRETEQFEQRRLSVEEQHQQSLLNTLNSRPGISAEASRVHDSLNASGFASLANQSLASVRSQPGNTSNHQAVPAGALSTSHASSVVSGRSKPEAVAEHLHAERSTLEASLQAETPDLPKSGTTGPPAGFADANSAGLERCWRPNDIDTQSLSAKVAGWSLSTSMAENNQAVASDKRPQVGIGVGGSTLDYVDVDVDVDALGTSFDVVQADADDAEDAVLDANAGKDHTSAKLAASATNEVQDASSLQQQVEQQGVERLLRSRSGKSAVLGTPESTPRGPPVGQGVEGIPPHGLLASVRAHRKRLRRERAALEVDLQRWRQDVAEQSRSKAGGDTTAGNVAGAPDLVSTARSQQLLAEVKSSLEARAHRINDDMKEARAVERLLVSWHTGAETAAAVAFGGAGQPVELTAAPGGAAGPYGADSTGLASFGSGALGAGAGAGRQPGSAEEAALLRRWQAHLSSWPASLQLAPASARGGTRAKSARSGVASARPTSARGHSARGLEPSALLWQAAASSGQHQRRPQSARAAPRSDISRPPAGLDEPLLARDVLAGHAAWLRGFQQQLTGAAGAPGRAVSPAPAGVADAYGGWMGSPGIGSAVGRGAYGPSAGPLPLAAYGGYNAGLAGYPYTGLP